MKIEAPQGKDDLTEFLLFHDKVYESRSARWPVVLQLHLPILTGKSPFSKGRKFRPLAVREKGEIVARAVAMLDETYYRHWNERLGHVLYFEALPNTREAVKALMDSACEWLKGQGAEAARCGFGLMEFPFVLDEYDLLPPALARQNPIYYHCLLKDAGFESEKGWVDYKIRVTPELVSRYQSAVEAGRRTGCEIMRLADVPESRRYREFTQTFNEAFKNHWGETPRTEEQFAYVLGPVLNTSVMAYRGAEPVGVLPVVREHSERAVLRPGRVLEDCEKLNMLGIGVRESARGTGVNLAMAGYGFLELIRRGAKYLSYTMVVDDNWPSRRTAEKLGAYVCANFMVYRRNFRH